MIKRITNLFIAFCLFGCYDSELYEFEKHDLEASSEGEIINLISQTKKSVQFHTDSAQYFMEKAMDMVKDIPNNELKAQVYSLEGFICLNIGKYEVALEYLNLAESLLSIEQRNLEKGLVNFRKGVLFLLTDEIGKAIYHANIALDIFEEFKDINGLAKTYNLIGGIYENQHNYSKGIHYQEKRLALYKERNNESGLASVYSNLSILYFKCDSILKSEYYVHEAIKINTALNNQLWLATNYLLNHKLLTKKGQFKEARIFLDKSNSIFLQMNDVAGSLETQIAEALFELEIKNNSKARSQLTGLLINNNAIVKQQKLEILEALVGLYASENKTDSALYYQSQLIDISELLNQQLLNSSLDLMLSQREFEHQKTIVNIEQEKLVQSNRIKSLLLVASVATIFSLVLLFLYSRKIWKDRLKERNQRRKLLREALERNKKELTLTSMHNLRVQRNNSKILDRIKKVQHSTGIESQRELDRIALELKRSLKDNSLRKFEVKFKNLHQAFVNYLKKHYPKLTRSEINVCIFLRMNMSSKEISTVLNRSVAGVDVDRSRIRKKVGLTDRKANLQEFFENLEV